MGTNKKDEEFVKLHVTGAPAIVRSSFTALARLNATWYRFLAACGIKLSPEDGVYVRTQNANRVSAGGKDRAFSAELDEPVREFISKFERHKKVHGVRLMFKEGHGSKALSASNAQSQSSPVGATTRRSNVGKGRFANKKVAVGAPSIVMGTCSRGAAGVATSSGTNGINKKHHYVSEFSGELVMNGGKRTQYGTRLRSMNGQRRASTSGNHVGAVKSSVQPPGVKRNRTVRRGLQGREKPPPTPRIDNIRSLVKKEPEVQIFDVESSETSSASVDEDGENGALVGRNEDYDWAQLDDNMSMCTAVTTEEQELIREGIQVEELKTPAMHRLERFSNAFILRARNEIRKLKRNNLWGRNVKRSPLACYLLQEILQS